jgi:hypothetical protein
MRPTKTPVWQLVALSVDIEEKKVACNADEPEYCRASVPDTCILLIHELLTIFWLQLW